MSKHEHEFTLVLSGVQELTRQVMDAFYEAGCDDAIVGMRDGVAYADFCREDSSFQSAMLSAIRDVEAAGVGAKVHHVEPDELVTMSEIARRLHITREGVRKRVVGLRGPGDFPTPAGNLTQRSPLWHWSDVVRWHQESHEGQREVDQGAENASNYFSGGSHIAALNSALDLRRRVSLDEATQLLRSISVGDTIETPKTQKVPRVKSK